MKRYLTAFAVTLAMSSGVAHAQQSGEPSLKQLELGDKGRGYAVVLDGDGNEHYCEAAETREAIDLGPCKPLRLVTPLTGAMRTGTGGSAMPTMSPAKAQVVALFEQNRCSLSYKDLANVLQRLDEDRRQEIAQAIAAMTERGEIADNAETERATLKTGTRCR